MSRRGSAAGSHSDARVLASGLVIFQTPQLNCAPAGGWRLSGFVATTGGMSPRHLQRRRPDAPPRGRLRTAAALFVAALPGGRRSVSPSARGAGVLQRYLQAVLPGSTACRDLDGAVLDVSAFEAPHAGRAVQSDALDFVLRSEETYDAIFVDIFDEANVCSAAFSEAPFLDAAKSMLADDGVLVHNLHIGGRKRDAAVARAEGALARHFHAAYRADSVDSTPTGDALPGREAVARARAAAGETRRVRAWGSTRGRGVGPVRLCCDDDFCK